jgi:hypothetical protein
MKSAQRLSSGFTYPGLNNTSLLAIVFDISIGSIHSRFAAADQLETERVLVVE